MCVIIYIPKGQEFTEGELKEAWYTNPDGAGYCIQKDNKVLFKRGFMTLESYKKEVLPLIGNYNLILHFRISTSKFVNKVQTHPYKKGNVSLTEGITERPVICMNGIISGQKEYLNCNDTMSYIVDHESAFSVINQDILNIIESDTGAKWAVMTPDKVLLSSKFEKYEGRYYSNKNHMWKTYFYDYTPKKAKKTFNNMILTNKLRKAIRKDKILHEDVLDFIDICCNRKMDYCNQCTKCLKTAKTLRDVKIILNENLFYLYEYGDYNDEEDEYNSCDCETFYLDDTYDYCNIFDE